MTQKYSNIVYTYKCDECNETNFTSKDYSVTEVAYFPFYDANGNWHYHDKNEGTVKLVCVNGHQTTKPYVNMCECGWSNVKLNF